MRKSGSVRGETRLIDKAIVALNTCWVVRFEGELGPDDGGLDLEPFLSRLHARMLHAEQRRLVVDLSALTWASESAIRTFVRWAMWIEGEPASRRYTLVLRLDSRSPWQIAAFRTLASVAPDAVKIAEIS